MFPFYSPECVWTAAPQRVYRVAKTATATASQTRTRCGGGWWQTRARGVTLSVDIAWDCRDSCYKAQHGLCDLPPRVPASGRPSESHSTTLACTQVAAVARGVRGGGGAVDSIV
jgi:hypothetical protein